MVNGPRLHFVMFHATDAEDAAVVLRIRQAALSVRAHYPKAQIVLLSAGGGTWEGLPDWVEVLSKPAKIERLMVERLDRYRDYIRQLPRGCQAVFMDTDMLLIRRIDGILAPGPDISVTIRNLARYPVNAGLIVADTTRHDQVTAFFEKLAEACETLSADQQRWYGDQTALKMILDPPATKLTAIKEVLRDGLRVRFAPAQVFNHTPTRALLSFGIFRPSARLLHFKGERKSQMTRYFRRYLSPTVVRFMRMLDRMAG